MALVTVIRTAYAQWQRIAKEQLPANLGNVQADLVTAPKIKAYNASGNDHYLYVGNDSGTSTEGFRFRSDSANSQYYLYVRNTLRLQFDAGNIYARDPLDFFDGDSLGWNNDDGSLGYNSTTNQFRLEDASDASKVVFDMDDGSGDLEGRLITGSTGQELVIFQPASAGTAAGGTNKAESVYADDYWRPETVGSEVYLTMPSPIQTAGTVLASVRFLVYSDGTTHEFNFKVRKTRVTASTVTASDITSFAGVDYRAADLTAIGSDHYYLEQTGGSLPFTFTTSAGEQDKVWAVIEIEAQTSNDKARFLGIYWKFREVKH
jgi:hypothetical protein